MDVSYINPFIDSVDTVFTAMLGVRPHRNAVKVSDAARCDVEQLTSLIGISGQFSGVVALRFPPPTALALAGRMLGAPVAVVNDEVVDAISELVNIVAGCAKAKFAHDPPLQLGLPTVVEGFGYKVKYPSRSIWLEVPFCSDAGDFCMEMTYCPN